MINVVEMEKRNSVMNYLAFNKNCNKNILFIGSCRVVPLINYYNDLDDEELKRNIYCILVHPLKQNYYNEELKEKMKEILVKTDIIVTECIKAYDFLNTESIHTEFDLYDKRVFVIPNLFMYQYHYEMFNYFNVESNNTEYFYRESLGRFRNKCLSLNYHSFWEKFEKYYHTVKFFSTHNHPTRVLSLLLFKYLIEKIKDIDIPLTFYKKFMNINFLESNAAPIFQIDVETYDIRYPYTLVDDEFLRIKNIFSQEINFDAVLYDIFN
jgi:hypothetical protein